VGTHIFFFILSNHLELFGIGSKTVEVEVDWSYIEQGFFCLRKASLELENRRMTQKWKTEKELEEQAGTMGKTSREVKAIAGKRSLLALVKWRSRN